MPKIDGVDVPTMEEFKALLERVFKAEQSIIETRETVEKNQEKFDAFYDRLIVEPNKGGSG